MAGKREKPEDIVTKLRQVDEYLARGIFWGKAAGAKQRRSGYRRIGVMLECKGMIMIYLTSRHRQPTVVPRGP